MARESWPVFIKTIARFQKPGEIGVGDTIHRLIPGADAFKAWFEEKFGKTCGCTDRQRWLNARFPYR